MASLLLVDDSVEINHAVQALFRNVHSVKWASNLREAQDIVASREHIDLVLLDIDMPDGNGIDFMQSFASQFSEKGIGVIFLTGTNDVNSRVRSYSLGAVDFIAKPFDLVELQVRVSNRLKGIEPVPTKRLLKRGPLEMDLSRQQAFETTQEAPRQLDLTPVEFRLLLLFLQKDGSVVSRNEILETVWGQTANVSTRCVDHHICGLRKKIASSGQKIESIYGVGYRIDVAS